ncbi:MAG TPA: elongation subunit of DNA-dependent DNA polymerase [Roseburia sp.]|nr:elongation subunit of DNA-dependent DNA polymerase [Roseburia sp.]
MKHWHEELPFNETDSLTALIFTENSLFFDIETTGFSAARTSLYLIGCAARKEDQLIVDQFFAETPAEESDVLHAFFDYLKNFDTIITFNGIGFDIPYLTNKCQKHKIPEPFSSYKYVDIYKMISGFRFLFALPNLKQKTVEQFLGLEREDMYNGGELIEVYQSYQRNPDKTLVSLLKQHNYEDVIDMPKLLSILSYVKLFDGAFSVTSLCANEYISYDGSPCRELLFSLQNNFPVPKHISCHYEDFHLVADADQTKLCVRLYTGELKYFLPDYKNYWYLPEEDLAIPSSLATSIPKERKKKATAGTCYEKKNAIFIPQYQEIQKPAFRHMFKDKKSYFELSENFIGSKEMQKEYCMHVLNFICRKKL